MKKILLLLSLVFSTILLSQTNEQVHFFNTVLNKEVYFVNKNSFINNQLSEQAIKLINEKTIYSRDIFTEDKIELTEIEIDFLSKELVKLNHLKAKKYLKNYPKIKLFSIIKPSKKEYKSFFSRPIFFRNNSVCLIYKYNYKGPENAGGGWILYKKENNKWIFWFNITSWIS